MPNLVVQSFRGAPQTALFQLNRSPAPEPARYASAVSATLVSPTKPKHASRGGSGLGDLWRVIVLNDNHNTFDSVARALASVLPGVGFDAGMRLATEIDRTGQAIVWGGHRELAELYWSQLEARGLTMAPLES